MSEQLRYNLSRLARGANPYYAWKVRERYLNRILDQGEFDEDSRKYFKDKYIGPEPEDVDLSDTVSGWVDRTAAMTKNSAMIGVNQIRQWWNEKESVLGIPTGERDAEDAQEAYDDITYYRGLQSSIPRSEGLGMVAQDVISSLPSLVENLSASVIAGYAGAKIGTAVGTMIAPGAGTAIGAGVGFVSGVLAGLGVNAAMEAGSAFDDNLRNEEIRRRLEERYGSNPELVDQAQRAVALEAADAVMTGNIVDPTNIASAMFATRGGQLFKGFLVAKAGAKTRFPNKFRVTKDALGGAATEAVQEGYQDALQQSVTQYQIAKIDADGDPDKIPDNLDIIKDIDYGRVGYSSLVGGIAGGAFTGTRSGIGKFADKKREVIRTRIRQAIDSGDLDQFNSVRSSYQEGTPERVIIEQEIKDIREGVHVDHRVDKDLTRYDMRNELANAMAEGKSGFEAFIKKNRNNPLFTDVVNDYFDKLRSAEVTAQQQAELERIRNQILIGWDERGWELTDENLRETMTQPDPEGRWGGEASTIGTREEPGRAYQGEETYEVPVRDASGRIERDPITGQILYETRTRPTSRIRARTPQDFATRTERKGAPKRLEDLTKPKSQRQVQEKKEAKPQEDFDVEKATRVQLINWLRQDDVDKGTYENQDVANAEYKRLMKTKKKGGESVQGLREMVKSRMPKQEEPKVEPTQEAQPKPKAEPKEEVAPREPEPVPEVSPERQAEINQIREEFLDDFANKDMGGQTILRNPDNSFKEIKLRRGDEERTYTAEDLDEMGYLSNNKENFLEGKVRNDLPQQPEPEVLKDADQQTETKEVSQEQVTEPEAVVEEEPAVVEPTKVEAEPPAEKAEEAPEQVTETKEEPEPVKDTTPKGEAPPELVLNFMSTLDPDENNYVVEEIRGRNNKFEGVQVDTYDTVNEEWRTKEFTADEARALQIVNKKNKIIPSAIQDYVRRAAIFANPKGPAGTPDQEIEMERTPTFTETEGAEAEAQTAGTLRPTKEAEARLTPVEIRSSVQAAMEDELASPTTEDLRDAEGLRTDIESDRDAEVGFTENKIAYNKIDGSTFVADELKEAGITNSQQKKPLAQMAEALRLQELSDLDGITFVKGTDKNKNHYRYEKGRFAGGKVNGISKNLLDKLQTFANNNGYTLNVIDEKTPLPKIEGVYKDSKQYPLLVAQAIKKTFGSASKFQNSISSNDPKGIRIYNIKPGETPVAGETVEDTGLSKDDKLMEATKRISNDGIADGFVAPLYVERKTQPEVQEEGKAPTKAELEAIEKGTDQEVEQKVKQEETVEHQKVEGEYVVNLFIDDDRDVAGVKGRAVSAIRIPFKNVTEKQLIDFIEALRSPESKKKVLLDKPLFSIAPDREVSKGPLDRTVIDKAVGEFTREFRGGVMLNFKVFDSPQHAQQETGIEFNPKARGALVGDQVYLFANNLKDISTARKVIFHESIGHYGVRNVLGDEDFNLFLDRVIAKNKSEVQAIAERYKKDGVFKNIGEKELRIAAEELVAEAAEGRANRTVIQRVIEALREFFAKHLGLLEPNEIKSVILRAEKAFRTGEIYFGADRSVFGSALDAQYSLGVFTREMSERTLDIPVLLRAHAERLHKEFFKDKKASTKVGSKEISLVNPFIYELAGDKLREYQKDRNIEEQAKLEEKLKEISARSSLLASQYGGYWVGPDGRWRYHVNDFDQNSKELWTFNLLKPDWFRAKNQKDYATQMFDLDKISELRVQRKIIEEVDLDYSPGTLLQHIKLTDFLDHEQLRTENKKIWDKIYVTFDTTLNRSKFTQRGANQLSTRNIRRSNLGTFRVGYNPFGSRDKIGTPEYSLGNMVLFIDVNLDRAPLVSMSTFVHELTHAIQDLHQLGMGSNPKMGGKFYEYDGTLFSRIKSSLESLFSEMSEPEIRQLQKYVNNMEFSLAGYDSGIAKTSTPDKFNKLLLTAKEILSGISEGPVSDEYTIGETSSSILNIYSAQVGHLYDMAADRGEFIDPDLNKDLWFNEFFFKLEDGMMENFGPNSAQHKRAKNLRTMARNLFAPHASGGSLEGIYMQPIYMLGNRLSPKWKRELQQRKNTQEFDHWMSLTNYLRTLGETEARHHQQNFIDQYQAFDRGDLQALSKMRDVIPLSKGFSIDYKHHDRNLIESENFKRFNETSPSFSMEDMLIILNESGERTQKVFQYADKSDEIRYSLSSERDPSESAPTWMNQAEKDVWLKFGDPHAGKSIREKFEKLKENLWTKVRQGMFDKFAPLKFLSDKAYIQARMSKSTDGPFSAMFQLGHIFMDEDGAIDVDTTKKSLVESMRPLGQDMDTFLRWVASNRAYDLKKGPKGRDALKFLTDAEIAVGMNFNRGTTINAETGKRVSRKKLFDDVLKDFQAVQNSVLDLSVKSGAVSKENAQLWKDQFYVPFYRVFDEDSSKRIGPNTIDGLVGQDAYKRLRGSDRGLADLMQNTMMNYHHLIDVSLKNMAATQSVSDLMKINGAVKLGKFPINNEAMREYFENLEGADQQMASLVQPDNGQTIYIRENGERVYYRISDPFVLEALMGINSVNKDNLLYKELRRSKRWFTYAVTADPDFKIANLLRDTIGSIAVAPTGYNPLSNVARGWKGTQKDSKTYSKLVAGGGAFIFGHVSGTDPTSEGARRLIEQGVKKEFIIDSPEKMGFLERMVKGSFSIARGAWGKYEDFGTRLENVNRAALYDKLRKEGKSHLEASFEARDLMDFSNTGSWGMIQYLSQWSPFLNARLQGMYKLGRGAVSPAQRVQFATTVFVYTMASLGLYLTHKDDEEFKEREEWDRDTYHWFKVPGFDTAVRIPKAFEVGTITTMVERMAEQMIDEEATGKLFRERMLFALTNTLAMDVRPQMLRPIIDIYSNKNPFTGRDIESKKMEGLNIEEKRNAYTSETATLLSRMNADTIGWDAVNLSPVQIEYAVQGFGAWIGASVFAATDSIIRMAEGKEAPGEGLKSIPVIGIGAAVLEPSVRRFAVDLSRPRRNTKYTTQFYEQMKEMNQTFSSIRELRQLGDMDRAMDKEKEERVLLRYRTSYNKLQRRISKLRTQMQRIANDPKMDGDLKQMRIDRIQAQINANIKVLQRRTNIQLREAS